nr:S-layer homology domain-containing protein [Microcoleus sp. FACHB-68]
MKLSKSAFLLTLSVTPALISVPTSAQTKFADIQTHWAKPCIEQLTTQQIIAGYPDGSFRPNEPVTRAEFAALINKAYSNTAPVRDASSFNDVSASNWAYSAIRQAYRTGFLSGYPNQVFNPNQNIPRVQVLVALANGLKYQPSRFAPLTLNATFEDSADIPSYAFNAVAAATEKRLAVNYPSVRSLKPNQQATRADVATFLCQALAGNSPSTVPAQYIAQAATTEAGKAWDQAKLAYTLPVDSTISNNLYTAITSLAISPDNQILAIGSHNHERAGGGDESTLSLWDLQTGQLVRTLFKGGAGESFGPSSQEPEAGLTGDILWSIAFSPDGKTVAAGLSNKTIKIWNVQTGAEVSTLTGHTYAVRTIAFSADGKTLASGSSDKTVKLWNVQTGQLIRTLTGHSGTVIAVKISPDGKTVASGSQDKTIKVWDLGTGQALRTLDNGGAVGTLAFVAGGQTLASTCGYDCLAQADDPKSVQALRMWDLKAGRVIPLSNEPAYQRAWISQLSPDGQILAGYVYLHPPGGAGRNQAILWSLATGRVLQTIEPGGGPFAFSPNGEVFVNTLSGKGVQVWR